MVDIIGQLEIFAGANDLHFIYGANHYASADRHNYKAKERVLVCEYQCSMGFNPNSMTNDPTSETYEVTIMIGQKFDTGSKTVASLDETMIQKHNRRLKALVSDGYALLRSFTCSNELLFRSIRFTVSPNMFSDNIDFINFQVSFENR